MRQLALCLSLLLGACAVAPPRTGMVSPVTPALISDWQHHRQSVLAFDRFLLEGRLAASGSPVSSRLRWQQDATRHFDVLLSGPLGQGSLRLRGNDTAVRIQYDQQDWTTSTPDADLERILGMPLPVTALRYWARGLPQPGAAARYDLDAEGRLLRLEQAGWRLDSLRYHPGEPALPARVALSRHDTTLTLLADRWRPQGG